MLKREIIVVSSKSRDVRLNETKYRSQTKIKSLLPGLTTSANYNYSRVVL